MKRIISLLLCCCFLFGLANAETTLPDKMNMQLQSGSGLKGNFSVQFGKENTKGSFEAIQNNGIQHFVVKDEAGNIQFAGCQNNGEFILQLAGEHMQVVNLQKRKSLILLGIVKEYLDIPATLETILQVLSFDFQYQMDTPMLAQQRRDEVQAILREAMQKYSADIDLWLQNYLFSKEDTKDANGKKILGLEYDVPVEDVKDFLKTLVADVAQNQFLVEALTESMPEEYAQLLLHFKDERFINLAIDAFPLQGNIRMGRSFSSNGTAISTYISLPMLDAKTGAFLFEYKVEHNEDSLEEYQNIIVSTQNGKLDLRFNAVDTGISKDYEGTVLLNAEKHNYAFTFTLSHAGETFSDAENKRHLHNSVTVRLQNDDAFLKSNTGYESIDNMEFVFSQKYQSGVAKNTSTKLEGEFTYKNTTNQENLILQYDVKTTAPWEVENTEFENILLIDTSLEKDYVSLAGKIFSFVQAKVPLANSKIGTWLQERLQLQNADALPTLEEPVESIEEPVKSVEPIETTAVIENTETPTQP